MGGAREKVDGKKTVQLDDQEATVTRAEHGIRMKIQKDADDNLRDRMEKEDKITRNNIETLRSDVVKLNAEVVGMKSRQLESAASTVAA